MSKRRYEPAGVSAIKDYETGEVMRRREVCERLEEVEKEVERLRAEGTNECRIWQRARIRELEAKVGRQRSEVDGLEAHIRMLEVEIGRLRRVLVKCQRVTSDIVYRQSPEACLTVYHAFDDEVQDAMADAKLALERDQDTRDGEEVK